MKPSDDLFRLIKTLSRTEKGYFKKYAQLHSSSKEVEYLLLFDEIDKQTDEYDEEKIVKKLRKLSVLKNLSVTKSYLFDLILKSQRAYHEQTMLPLKSDSQINNIEILAEKGLFDLAEKLVEKQIAFSVEYDNKLMLLKTLKSQRKYNSEFKTGKMTTLENLNQSIECLDAYKTDLEYARLFITLFTFLRKQMNIRNEQERNEWDLFMQQPLLVKLPDNASFHSRLYFYQIHYGFHYLSYNQDRQGKFIRQAIDLWEEYPHLKKVDTNIFLGTLNNYFNYCYPNGHLTEFEDYLQQQPTPISSPKVQASWFTHVSLWKIIIHTIKHTIEECVALADDVYKQLNEQYQGKIDPSSELILYNNCSIIYICSQQFDKSLTILQYLLDYKKATDRNDIKVHLRIWYLVVHLELQNDLLLEHAIRSVKRYAVNQELYYEFEALFMRFFQKYINTPLNARLQLFSPLLESIEELEENNPIEAIFIRKHHNLKLWVIHKITGKNILYLAQNYRYKEDED